jgi:ATP-dependent Lon protease
MHNTGPTTATTLAAFVALCSALLGKPLQQQMVVLGSMSLGGNIVPVENLAESLQVAFDAGAKRLLSDGERQGHPDHSRRAVRQVPDGVLR